MMKKVVSILLYYIGMIFKHSDGKILSLYFHNPSPSAFEKIVQWIINKKYDFIDLPTLLDKIDNDKNIEGHFAFVSFDDGWQNNLKLVPLIRQYKVPVTIFVPIEPLQSGNYWWEYVGKKYSRDTFKMEQTFKTYSEDKFNQSLNDIKEKIHIERSAMTLSELAELSNNPLVNIQSHSYSHPILTNLSDESLDYELGESKCFLEKYLNKEIYALSYPNGSLSVREVNCAKKYYKCAFTTVSANPDNKTDLYNIPRIALTNDYWSNLAKISGGWNIISKLKKKYINLLVKR